MMRYRALFSDGYYTTVIKIESDIGALWKLEGSRRIFGTITELESYYKGSIQSMRLE